MIVGIFMIVMVLGGDLIWVVMGRYCYVSFGYEWLDCVLRVQSVTWVGMLISPSAPVSSTGTGFDPLPSRERGIRLVLSCSPVPPCRPSGLRIKSAMTATATTHPPCGLTSL